MNSEPGTYALVLRSDLHADLRIGEWGYLRVEAGYYVYVGSAFGPGGVRARVSRHLQEKKRKHWHIDYLREIANPEQVWCSYSPCRLEHQWARSLSRVTGFSCIEGFGSSDCRCAGHLFVTPTKPNRAELTRVIDGATEAWRSRLGT